MRKRKQLVFKVVSSQSDVRTYYLGAHAPNLTQEDINLIHQIWLDVTAGGHPEVHHRDIVRIALEDLQQELREKGKEEVFQKLSH